MIISSIVKWIGNIFDKKGVEKRHLSLFQDVSKPTEKKTLIEKIYEETFINESKNKK